MRRTVLWVALIALYAAAYAARAGVGSREFDPMSPRLRAVEHAIGEHRFADALPLALQVAQSYPTHPLPAYWIARIQHGLDRPQDEAAAWEAFVALTSRPQEACPDLAIALDRAGHPERALAAIRQCAQVDPRDPERWLDLGDALARTDQLEAADAAYRRGLLQDAVHAVLLSRVGATAHEGEQ